MTAFPQPIRPASSLVITLLIISAVGAVLLTASRSLLDSTRIAAATDSASSAELMAQNGIEEGLLRYKVSCPGPTFCGLNSDGEYGDFTKLTGQVYSLQPMRRGFLPQNTSGMPAGTPSCSVPSNDGVTDPLVNTSYDPNCPYFDLTVRRQVALIQPTDVLTLTNRELPLKQKVLLNINHFTNFTISLPSNTTSKLDYTTVVSGAGTPESGTLDPATNPQVTINGSGTTGINLTVPNVDLAGQQVTIKLFGQGGVLLIYKGVITIDSTGYAGGITRKKIMYIHGDGLQAPFTGPYSANQNYRTYDELDFAHNFSVSGILQ